MKNLGLGLFFCLQIFSSSGNFNPENTIFAFDLHYVILFPKVKEMARIFISESPKGTVVPLMLNPLAIYRMVNLIRECPVAEKVFDDFSKTYRSVEDLKSIFLKIMNCQELNRFIICLIQAIRNMGYKTYILSNIGAQVLKHFLEQEPEVAKLFDGFYVPSSTNYYLRKPDPFFFDGFKDYLANFKDQNKNIIFIDDLDVNVTSAKKLGYFAIKYKSNFELVKTLEAFGIFKSN